jgi:hypothetical protein
VFHLVFGICPHCQRRVVVVKLHVIKPCVWVSPKPPPVYQSYPPYESHGHSRRCHRINRRALSNLSPETKRGKQKMKMVVRDTLLLVQVKGCTSHHQTINTSPPRTHTQLTHRRHRVLLTELSTGMDSCQRRRTMLAWCTNEAFPSGSLFFVHRSRADKTQARWRSSGFTH